MTKTDFAELKEKLVTFDFGKWWFINGGHLHRLWKTKQYTVIFEQARELPMEAAKHQFDKSAAIISELIDIIKSQSEALEHYSCSYQQVILTGCELAQQSLSDTTTRLQKLRDGINGNTTN